MAFRYPNGQLFSSNSTPNSTANETSKTAKRTNFANRGMHFEEAINHSNDYYLTHDIAVIHKKPTPLQIVKVDYPRRSAAVIKEAYFRQPSTTDYNGVYKGYYLDFEAKETKNKTSFPFKNFHEHQINHMRSCSKQGGICFILLWFSSIQRCFFLSSEVLITLWEQQASGKKSMTLTQVETEGIEIYPKIAPRIPYLDAVDEFICKKE
ncbi:Holliday junction resolvase RecU [Enterococcus sp. AZ072]|uniref:Holliday junction resolvase RecU n=1 Tax=unclassified Enterococcus TaxID=2608891 RepID=UPI003D282506